MPICVSSPAHSITLIELFFHGDEVIGAVFTLTQFYPDITWQLPSLIKMRELTTMFTWFGSGFPDAVWIALQLCLLDWGLPR